MVQWCHGGHGNGASYVADPWIQLLTWGEEKGTRSSTRLDIFVFQPLVLFLCSRLSFGLIWLDELIIFASPFPFKHPAVGAWEAMGSSWSSSGQVQAFPSKADFSQRRSSSALLDKGFAALERDFELSQRAERLGSSSPRSSDAEDVGEDESPQVSPKHGSESWLSKIFLG